MNVQKFLEVFLTAFLAILPIVNPLGAVPVLLGLTAGKPLDEVRRIGTKAAIYSGCMMVTALFFGSKLMRFFGIQIPSLRIAGGLVIAYVGFRMLFPPDNVVAQPSDNPNRDLALIPLALPTLTGAGTFAVILTLAANQDVYRDFFDWGLGYAAVTIAIALVAAISGVCLRYSNYVLRLLGKGGLNVSTRLVGLVMVCLGIQFVGEGVKAFSNDNPILPAQSRVNAAMKEALRH